MAKGRQNGLSLNEPLVIGTIINGAPNVPLAEFNTSKAGKLPTPGFWHLKT